MKVSDIFDTIMDINRLIDVMLQNKHDLATQDIEKICNTNYIGTNYCGSRLPCGLCLITNQPCPMCPIVFGGPTCSTTISNIAK